MGVRGPEKMLKIKEDQEHPRSLGRSWPVVWCSLAGVLVP